MRYLNRAKSLAATAVITSAVSLAAIALATPASAAPSANGWSLCVDNYLNKCDYWTVDNAPYSADLGKLVGSSSGDQRMQDTISSIQISGARTLYTWNDNDFKGIQGVFQNNFTWNVLNYPYNDSISSIRTWS
ncbi:hypothetical protein ACGFNV_43485 [Streptomyces sp. NPDC048751]|uniref:hypothetical protein n=1 Tax=Streptomyces sp. NPDC048751 TaxID=3365591 RepID=UPI00371E66E6